MGNKTDIREHLMSVYAPQDVTFIRGEGAYLWDDKNNKYLDYSPKKVMKIFFHFHLFN